MENSETPALFQEAKKGNIRFFLQFGGQGALWYNELVKYRSDSRFDKFFQIALNAIREEWPNVKESPGFELGLDPELWLRDESKLPPEEYLESTSVSMPMIQVTQLAHLENLMLHGFDRTELLRYTVGASGHSQGLISAALFALGLDGDDYYEMMARVIKYVLYLGVRSQEAFPYLHPTEEEVAKSDPLGSDSPAPMVALVGESHEKIVSMVDEVNGELPEDAKIYISLYNSPRNRILSSRRSSLIRFHERFHSFLEERKVKYTYLKTTCPFHSPYMEPIRHTIEKDIGRIGFHIPGSLLKIPVISFTDGRDIRQDEDTALTMYRDMAINTLYWNRALRTVIEEKQATHIIDLGPGKTTQRFSSETLAEAGMELPVLAAAISKDQKKLFA